VRGRAAQAFAHAWRAVAARPSSSAAIAGALAVGLAAGAVVFAVLDAAVLRPFPFPAPERLVGIGAAFPRLNRPLEFFEALSGPEFAAARGARSLAAVTGFDLGNEPVMVGETPERVFTAYFWGDPIAVLGIGPAAGRAFSEEELRTGAPVAIVSDRFWREALGRRPGADGSSLRVGGRSYTIVGIMPPRVRLYDTDLWVPLAGAPDSLPRTRRQFNALGRLAEGTSVAAVTAELEIVARQLEQAHAASTPEYLGFSLEARPWTEIEVWGYGRVTALALAATGLLLLLLTANLANLLLARALDRRREMAVRTALGATRGALVGQVLAEVSLLCAAGAVAGLALAWLGIRVTAAVMGDLLPDTTVLHLSGRVAAGLGAAAAVLAVLVSVAPASHAAGRDVADALAGDGSRTAGTPRARRIRSWLVATEVAIAVVVTGSGALLAAQVSRLLQVDPGFPVEHLLAARVTLPLPKYDGRSMGFFDAVLERLGRVPAIAAASLSNQPPPGAFSRAQFTIEGAPPADPLPSAFYTTAGPRYRDTFGFELVRGRWFDERAPRDGIREIVVNDAAAARFFGASDPIGRRLRVAPPHSDERPATIVGVVKSVRNRGLSVPPAPELIASVRQIPDRRQSQLYVVARGRAGTEGLLDEIRRAIRAVDPEQPVYAVSTIASQYRAGVGVRRAAAVLLGAFALLALGLAALGLFSVLSHTVASRTREMGVRGALGATRGRLILLVMTDALGAVAVGAAAGIGLLIAGARVLASQVFGIQPEAGPLAAAVSVLLVVAAMASLVPARRAARVDPVHALRH
jgi:predicted permease